MSKVSTPDINGWYDIDDTSLAENGKGYIVWLTDVGIALATFFTKGSLMENFSSDMSVVERLNTVEGQFAEEDGFYFMEVGDFDTEWFKFGKQATHWRPEPKPPETANPPTKA